MVYNYDKNTNTYTFSSLITDLCVCPKETWYWDGSNVTDMVWSGVKCTGNEMSLSQCQRHKVFNCQKSAARFAAGVICSESEWF